MIVLISFLCLLPAYLGYSTYKKEIPNADNVLHPCIPDYRWPGVGHKNRNGGGSRNVFGEAFARAGNKWSKTLCQQDSDGDGRTNGEELGDPDCVWSPSKLPSRAVNITNPGVCEPLHDPKCMGKNSFVTCEKESFDNCSVINNTDVQTIDLRFPEISIPPTETNYFCMSFDLPNDQDYHIVADQPIVINANVVHHMLLYGCENASSTFISSPTSCGMSGSECGAIIGGWTVGRTGQCYGDKIGFRIGVEHYVRVRLELHYNNPQKEANFKDSSGLRLYIRPARPEVQDLFTFMTGQNILELPPGQTRVEEVGVCKSDCTRHIFKEPVYLVNALNHMHYLGRSMRIELHRGGNLISNLTNEESYSYDSPMTHTHSPHVKILPGDEITTKCVYNTTSRKAWAHFGLATSEEMCYGFLTMYPKSAVDKRSDCVSFSALSICDLKLGTPVNDCDWARFLSSQDLKDIEGDLHHSCKIGEACSSECKDVVRNISHPCFQPEMIKFIKHQGGQMKLACLYQSCLDNPSQNFTQQCVELFGQSIHAGAVSIVLTSTTAILTVILKAGLPLLLNDW